MYVLGHQNMNYFINYDAVHVKRFTASYGEWPLDITISSRPKQQGRMSLRERKLAGV